MGLQCSWFYFRLLPKSAGKYGDELQPLTNHAASVCISRHGIVLTGSRFWHVFL